MLDWFISLDPAFQALLAGLFTWGVAADGAAAVLSPETSIASFWTQCWGFPVV
jgi:hypothetical protein